MSARQIAALLKSNRQDGWTNNNNNRNAHQVHNNNNVINTTMYPEQQLSAGLIGQIFNLHSLPTILMLM